MKYNCPASSFDRSTKDDAGRYVCDSCGKRVMLNGNNGALLAAHKPDPEGFAHRREERERREAAWKLANATANSQITVLHLEGQPFGNDFIVRDFQLGIRLGSFYAGPDATEFANAKRKERAKELVSKWTAVSA